MFTLGETYKLYQRGDIQPYTYIPVLGEARPIIVNGLCTLIYASPKVGKTEFLMQSMLRLVVPKTAPKRVIWYTEEYDENIWGNRIGALDPLTANEIDQAAHIELRDGWHTDLTADIHFEVLKHRSKFLEGIEWDDNPDHGPTTPVIVIVDTIKLLRIKDENDSAAIRRAVEPLYALSKELKFTLILVHHARKTAGLWGQNAAGGYDFMGAVDVVVELNRTKEKGPRRRVSVIGGRGVTEADYEYLMEENGRLVWSELEGNDVTQYLKENTGMDFSGAELKKVLGLNQRKFENLVQHSYVKGIGAKRGKRYTYAGP